MIFLGETLRMASKGSPSAGGKGDKRPQRTRWLGTTQNRDTGSRGALAPDSEVLGMCCCPAPSKPTLPQARAFSCVLNKEVSTKHTQNPRSRAVTGEPVQGNGAELPDEPAELPAPSGKRRTVP